VTYASASFFSVRKSERTVRCLGIGVGDASQLSEQIDLSPNGRVL
jgi:hypothetical protein